MIAYDNDSTTSSSSINTKTGLEEETPVNTTPAMSIETSSLASIKQQMMRQSTIYRRHQARLARSYALRDDPRPAFIRVLSGLPGFRMIVPPYQSKSKTDSGQLGEQKEKQKTNVTNSAPGAYSEETFFTPYSGATDNAVGATFTGRKENTNFFIDNLEAERAMQAMLATGVCSGAAEYFFSYCNNARTQRLEATWRSPFLNSDIAGAMTKNMTNRFQDYPLIFQHKGSMTSGITGPSIFRGNTRGKLDSVNNYNLVKIAKKARPSNDAFSKAMSKAFPISILFGTKIFFNSLLETALKNNELGEENFSLATSDILSSAIAGGMVGFGHLAMLKVQRQQKVSKSSPQTIIQKQNFTIGYLSSAMRRNIVAATLYFSIYNGISTCSLISKTSFENPGETVAFSTSSTIHNISSNERKGMSNVAAGGALAGIAHAAVMNHHRYRHYGSMIWWRRIMLPAASRAAPTHAFIFFGYEKMKEGVNAM